MRRTLVSLVPWVVAVCTLMMAGCGGGGSSPTEPDMAGTGGDTVSSAEPAGAAEGILQVKMIDAPADEICELHVYIRDLRVKPDGQPQMLLGTDLGDYDLLELQDGPPADLGSFPVSQGLYQFIEILLDESRSYVVEKEDPADPANTNCLPTPSPLQVPSAKFKVAGGPFTVDENTTVTIDFDAGKSLKKKGGNSGADKGWQLKPDVSVSAVAP